MPAGNHAKPRGPLTSFGPDDVSQPLEIATKVAYEGQVIRTEVYLFEMACFHRRSKISYGMGSGVAGQIPRVRTDLPDQGRSAFTAFGSRRRACKESECFLRRLRIKDGDKMFLAPAKRVTVW